MKKLMLINRPYFILFVLIIPFIISCNKEDDPVITSKILTSNAWMLEEHIGVFGNVAVAYKRGGTGNTQNFDNEYIVFKSDKTGFYHDNDGYETTLTWDFANSENTKLIYTLNFPNPPGVTVVSWENISYDNGKLIFTQSYNQMGKSAYSQNIRIPKR